MRLSRRALPRALANALRERPIEIRRRRELPFGLSWTEDISWFLHGERLGVAFDVGAHRGETTTALLAAFPAVSVHAFEPLPESFAALCAACPNDRVRTVNAAVSDCAGSLTLARAENSVQTGVGATGEPFEAVAVTVDDYADEQGLQRIGLLKVDTEGHEPAVLRGASRRLAEGLVDFVLCECEFSPRPSEPHASFAELHGALEPLGYRVVAFYNGGVDESGWIWGDVLYRRAPQGGGGEWSLSPQRRRSR